MTFARAFQSDLFRGPAGHGFHVPSSRRARPRPRHSNRPLRLHARCFPRRVPLCLRPKQRRALPPASPRTPKTAQQSRPASCPTPPNLLRSCSRKLLALTIGRIARKRPRIALCPSGAATRAGPRLKAPPPPLDSASGNVSLAERTVIGYAVITPSFTARVTTRAA